MVGVAEKNSIAHRARRGEPLADVFVVDAHGHIGHWADLPLLYADAESVIEEMDRIRIDWFCFSSIEAATGLNFTLGNNNAVQAVKKYPDRFFGYIVLYPYHPDGVMAEIERCEKAGLRGLKIHNVHGASYLAEAYRPGFEHADRNGWPVLAHTWDEKSVKEIRALAEEFKNANWILGHSGAQIYKPYVEIARACPNAWLELCCSLTPNRLVERMVNDVGADRILYGSDMNFISAAQQIGRVALADISEDDKRKILGENAKGIFKL